MSEKLAFIERRKHSRGMSKNLNIGVTITIGYECYNKGEITQSLLAIHIQLQKGKLGTRSPNKILYYVKKNALIP